MTHHDDNIDVRHLCPLPHRGHAPDIHPPATICHHHTQRIHDTITDITRLWELIPDLDLTARDGGGTPGGTKSVPPTRLDLLALTDHHTAWDSDIPPASRILLWLAAHCAHTRHLTPARTPQSALTMLGVHHLALTDHPQPHDVWAHLTRLHTHLRWIAGESPTPLQRPCDAPHPDPQITGECGGTVWTTGRHTGIIAACHDCGASLTDTALVLDAMQRHNATQPFTATHITIDTA